MTARLLTASDVGDSVPPWARAAIDGFRAVVSGDPDPFPCYFATRADRDGWLRYTYLTAAEIAEPYPLRDALVAFLAEAGSIAGRSALIAIAEPAEGTLADDEAAFWSILQFLHDHDVAAWPATVPSFAENPLWEFCFAGEPIFVTGHSPHYRRRRSRRSEAGLVLVIQTRTNLAGIVGHSLTAQRVRHRIRTSVASYDDLPPSPELGEYGDPHVREWRQYWLPDSNEVADRGCPLVLKRREPSEETP